jgi:hypothetical protein
MHSFSQPSTLIINNVNGINTNQYDNNIDNQLNDNLKIQNTICNLIDVINDNNLNFYYQDNKSSFKYNIDQLNLKFYLETEKILSSIDKKIYNENKLFLILFKQITLYIKEIERLNSVLIGQSKDPNFLKKKLVIFSQKKNDLETKEMLIQSLKTTIKSLEKKLSELIESENNLREENDKLKKEIKYYKEQNEILLNISSNSKNKRKSKRTFSGINQSFMNNATITINSKIKNDINLYGKTPQKKSSSKLKIIKAVKNKISYSSNNKKSYNYNNISNFNTTSITNNNIKSNGGSNRSSNVIEEKINTKTQRLNINITKIKKTISNPFNSCHIHSNSNILPNSNYDDINVSIINNNCYFINKELEEIENFENLFIKVKDYLIEKCNNDFYTLDNDNYNVNNNDNLSFENNYQKNNDN